MDWLRLNLFPNVFFFFFFFFFLLFFFNIDKFTFMEEEEEVYLALVETGIVALDVLDQQRPVWAVRDHDESRIDGVGARPQRQ